LASSGLKIIDLLPSAGGPKTPAAKNRRGCPTRAKAPTAAGSTVTAAFTSFLTRSMQDPLSHVVNLTAIESTCHGEEPLFAFPEYK
jgi:hypothetical protein